MAKVFLFNNIDKSHPKEINVNWGRNGHNKLDSIKLNSVAPYLAMFAPSLPEFFISKYTKSGETVFDPFSGRGTTAFTARKLERNSYSSDLSPYAFVLTKLKASVLKKKVIIAKINQLEREAFPKWSVLNQFIHLEKKYEELKIYYADKTLKILIFLRETLGKNWKKLNFIENAVLVFALGIMHGPSKKNGDSSYFSLSMSNSISMAPNYVNNYAKKNSLKKPLINVFAKIRERIEKKYDSMLNQNYSCQVYYQDATCDNVKIPNNSVDLIFTSPPYLNIVNYTGANWLKFWLLGYERKELKKEIKLSDNLNYDQYLNFIKQTLKALWPKLKLGKKICLVVGDVYGKELIEGIWKKIKDEVDYDFVCLYQNEYEQTKKNLNKMNKKKGKATNLDKVLVLKKISSFDN